MLIAVISGKYNVIINSFYVWIYLSGQEGCCHVDTILFYEAEGTFFDITNIYYLYDLQAFKGSFSWPYSLLVQAPIYNMALIQVYGDLLHFYTSTSPDFILRHSRECNLAPYGASGESMTP